MAVGNDDPDPVQLPVGTITVDKPIVTDRGSQRPRPDVPVAERLAVEVGVEQFADERAEAGGKGGAHRGGGGRADIEGGQAPAPDQDIDGQRDPAGEELIPKAGVEADGVHRGDDHEAVIDGVDGAPEVGASLLRRIDPDAVLPGALGERGAQAHARGLVGVDLVDQLLHAGAHMLAALGDREVQGHDQVVVVRRERSETARVLGAAQPHRHRRSLIALGGEGRGVGAAQGGGPGRGAPRRGGLGEGAEQQRQGDQQGQRV